MKVAELTAAQAAALDPALLQPGQAIAVRFDDLQAVIGPLPGTDAPVPMLVGELRDYKGDPIQTEDVGFNVKDVIRTAPATRRGLWLLLFEMESLAYGWRRAS